MSTHVAAQFHEMKRSAGLGIYRYKHKRPNGPALVVSAFSDRVANMLRSTKLYGNCFAGNRQQLEPEKQRRNQRVANLTLQLAPPA